MRLKTALLTLSLILPTSSFASEAGNILACIEAIESHTGKIVDEFDVDYTGKSFKDSVAKWEGIECKVKLDSVNKLTVDGKVYVIDGFAGYPARSSYRELKKQTKDAVSLLESRIKLLEKRLKKSKEKLKSADVDISKVEEYISVGISKATGK